MTLAVAIVIHVFVELEHPHIVSNPKFLGAIIIELAFGVGVKEIGLDIQKAPSNLKRNWGRD